jgi:aldehyde:ferredoxin oxidoreductase|tara:strand:- start:10078 stop:10542 length:465 start_codon:yes stop_codon:yes gene_type:complete
MKKIVNIIFGHVTCFFFVFNILFFSTVSYAEEKVATVNEGDPAPFTGTLFNTEAAARLLIDLETSDELCDIECEKKIQIREAELKFDYDILKASHDALQLKYDETIIIKNDQIYFLEKQIKHPRFQNELIFATGVVTGVGLVMASAYTLNQISK